MILYWQNAVDNFWNTPGNWFLDANATLPLGSSPWTQNDTYISYSLSAAYGATASPTIRYSVGDPNQIWNITGTCYIDNITNNTGIYSGTFAGKNFINNRLIYNSVFYGDHFTNNGEINTGTFATSGFLNLGVITNDIIYVGSNFVNFGTLPCQNYSKPVCNRILSIDTYNANYDIVWSFQYSLCSNQNSSGGFSTFLYDPTVGGSIANAGSPGAGLGSNMGYGYTINNVPMSFTAIPGVALSLGFDTSGSFGLASISNTSGLTARVVNSCNVRYGTRMQYLSTIPIPFNIADNTQIFHTLRCRFSDVAQTLQLSYLNGNVYEEIATIYVPLSITDLTGYNVGLAYSAPVYHLDNQSIFEVTNFHTHGTAAGIIPTTVSIPPNIFPDYTPPSVIIVPPVIPPVIPPDQYIYGLSANEGYAYTGNELFETQHPDDQIINTQASAVPTSDSLIINMTTY